MSFNNTVAFHIREEENKKIKVKVIRRRGKKSRNMNKPNAE